MFEVQRQRPFPWDYMVIIYLSRFFDFLVHPNLSATLATDQKWPVTCLYMYLLPKFSMHYGKLHCAKLCWEIKDYTKGHFWSVATVVLRLGCTKQSKNLERYLMII